MKESKLRDLVERLSGLMRAEQRAAGIEDQLQPVHQNVLRYLARCNRYSNTPAAVTEFLQITKGTVSQSIRLLERRGLVLKRPDKQDGRIVRLRLSANGHRLVAKLDKQVSWARLGENIDTVALDDTEQTLTTVLRELQKRNDYRSFGQCHTCHHCLRESQTKFRCGLTGEDLRREETLQICREHKAVVVNV